MNDLNLLQDTITSFFGKLIIINESLFTQISVVAAQDEMLTYNNRILQIGDVKWQISLTAYRLILHTATKTDDPRMKEVVKYLSSIYGEPGITEDMPNTYFWPETFYHQKTQNTEVKLCAGHSEGSRIYFKFANKPIPWCGNAQNPWTWP